MRDRKKRLKIVKKESFKRFLSRYLYQYRSIHEILHFFFRRDAGHAMSQSGPYY